MFPGSVILYPNQCEDVDTVRLVTVHLHSTIQTRKFPGSIILYPNQCEDVDTVHSAQNFCLVIVHSVAPCCIMHMTVGSSPVGSII